MKIALVSCTKLKQNYPCEAQNMYLPSQLFKKARNYIENNNNYDIWFILSAKYGLLKPTDIIEPYNITLNTMKKNEIVEWSYKVYNQLCTFELSQVDFYAGEKYRKYLIPLLQNKNINIEVPLKGLGIGQQLKFYKEEVSLHSDIFCNMQC